jgi:hypothetical protein
LSELEIENIQLGDKHDWTLIVESMGPSILERFCLCPSSSSQLLATAEATDLFLLMFKSGSQDEVYQPAAYQTSFHLDIAHLSHLALVHAENVLSRSFNLDCLYVSCSSVEASLSNSTAQVLGSVSWATLKSLVLYGDNINEWIRLCANVDASQLHSFEVRGVGSTPLHLFHSSALFLQKLVVASPIVTLRIENIILQDKDDWMPIIKSVDPSSLKNFKLCRDSKSQLQT